MQLRAVKIQKTLIFIMTVLRTCNLNQIAIQVLKWKEIITRALVFVLHMLQTIVVSWLSYYRFQHKTS